MCESGVARKSESERDDGDDDFVNGRKTKINESEMRNF